MKLNFLWIFSSFRWKEFNTWFSLKRKKSYSNHRFNQHFKSSISCTCYETKCELWLYLPKRMPSRRRVCLWLTTRLSSFVLFERHNEHEECYIMMLFLSSVISSTGTVSFDTRNVFTHVYWWRGGNAKRFIWRLSCVFFSLFLYRKN